MRRGGVPWARRQLLEDAKADGCKIDQEGDAVRISCRKGSIILWPDGAATRGDVRLDAALKIRTYRAMREVLGLEWYEVERVRGMAEERQERRQRAAQAAHESRRKRSYRYW